MQPDFKTYFVEGTFSRYVYVCSAVFVLRHADFCRWLFGLRVFLRTNFESKESSLRGSKSCVGTDQTLRRLSELSSGQAVRVNGGMM